MKSCGARLSDDGKPRLGWTSQAPSQPQPCGTHNNFPATSITRNSRTPTTGLWAQAAAKCFFFPVHRNGHVIWRRPKRENWKERVCLPFSATVEIIYRGKKEDHSTVYLQIDVDCPLQSIKTKPMKRAADMSWKEPISMCASSSYNTPWKFVNGWIEI